MSYAGYGAFGVALIAMLGSLFLSDALGWIPCTLCWYQRVFMYPLVFVIGISVVRRDGSWPLTTLVIGGIGWLVALYHSLLQWGVISEALAPCVDGVSCVTENGVWFGFITIPFMSLVAFTAVVGFSVIALRGVKDEQRV